MKQGLVQTLRICIDGRKIFDGGIGIYTQNLIAGLLQLRSERSLELSVLGDKNEIQQFPWASELQIIHEQATPYSLDEYFFLGRRMQRRFEKLGFDIFHEPHFTLPLGMNIPASVVTIHDLIHLTHPEKKYYPFIARRLIQSAVKRADRVITVSASVARDLVETFDEQEDLASKLSVIPNAFDEDLRQASQEKVQLEKRFHLKGNYFLVVLSMLKPHKGYHDVLEAYARFRELLKGEDLPELVLVGKGTEGPENLQRLLDSASALEGLRVLGRVRKAELAELISGARALLMPSLAEGFCLPVLEAQHLGTPVLSRPVPAVCELLSDNDFIARDFSIEALSELFAAYLHPERFSNAGVQMGRGELSEERLAAYSRCEVAKETLRVYEGIGRPARRLPGVSQLPNAEDAHRRLANWVN